MYLQWKRYGLTSHQTFYVFDKYILENKAEWKSVHFIFIQRASHTSSGNHRFLWQPSFMCWTSLSDAPDTHTNPTVPQLSKLHNNKTFNGWVDCLTKSVFKWYPKEIYITADVCSTDFWLWRSSDSPGCLNFSTWCISKEEWENLVELLQITNQTN